LNTRDANSTPRSRHESRRGAARIIEPPTLERENKMNRILVATDGSPPSAEAVAFAVDLASEHQSELICVHVVPAFDVVSRGLDSVAFPHEPSEHDHALLDDAAAVAAEHGIAAATALLRGQTVEEIMAFADSHDVELIVVGSRGHGAIANALLGSVSRRILRESKRPVLIVRAAAIAEPAAV
jgi:nucleotide-binding universal stress UspA family protein